MEKNQRNLLKVCLENWQENEEVGLDLEVKLDYNEVVNKCT